MNYRLTSKNLILLFLIALGVRVALVIATPQGNSILDLCIYIDSGQLVSHGVNPYDFNDNPALRQQLRQDDFAFTPFTCSTQDKWDYFASSNLPLALLTFGMIDTISSSYFFYRFVFAFLDSLLSVLILYFVFRKIPIKSSFSGLNATQLKWLTGIGLGALNPVLLLNGTIIAEHKGTAVLLLMAALLTAQSPRAAIKNYLSPILLGLSIAFIGLGIFLLPLCLWYACWQEQWGLSRKVAESSLRYIGVVVLTALICFLPFLPEVFEMMWLRIAGSMGLVDHTNQNWYPYFAAPYHSSAWRIVYMGLPEGWEVIKNGYLLLFVILTVYGVWQRKYDMRLLSANVLILFLGVFLLDGSLDRINMALLPSMLLVGQSQGKKVFPLILLYWIGGALDVLVAFLLQVNPEWETLYLSEFKIFESAFVLAFLISYLILLIRTALVPHSVETT